METKREWLYCHSCHNVQRDYSSDAGTPPPELEAAVLCNRVTQTSPPPTQDTAVAVRTVQDAGTQVGQVTVADQGTQVLSRPHQSVSYTQTPSRAPTSDRGTEMPQRTSTTTGTQMPRVGLTDNGTDMPPVLVTSSGC